MAKFSPDRRLAYSELAACSLKTWIGRLGALDAAGADRYL
jgi:hypothetical protein